MATFKFHRPLGAPSLNHLTVDHSLITFEQSLFNHFSLIFVALFLISFSSLSHCLRQFLIFENTSKFP
jgi:hypothetical protein